MRKIKQLTKKTEEGHKITRKETKIGKTEILMMKKKSKLQIEEKMISQMILILEKKLKSLKEMKKKQKKRVKKNNF